MTLCGRLTIAFLAAVLGPLLLGASVIAATATTVSHHRAEERLQLAAATVRVSVGSLCQQLHAVASAVAVVADRASQSSAATELIGQGLASAVLVISADGSPAMITPGAPAGPWLDCDGADSGGTPVRAIAARVEVRDRGGAPAGVVLSARTIDESLIGRLAAATGTTVSLLREVPGGAAPPPSGAPPGLAAPTGSGHPDGVSAIDDIQHNSDGDGGREAMLATAERITGEGIAESAGGRYVGRVGPSPGQPLPLVLAVTREQPRLLYAVLVLAVGVAGVLAVVAARRLASSTVRPLTDLAGAADRVADGDLTARVPVPAPDELARLASAFNRMTRETQSYVQALTLSRDQLRGHLTVLGDTLASTHDLQRILRVILRTAVAATGARAGLLLLLDQSTGALVSQCAEGLTGRPRSGDPPIPFGIGLLGGVAATGEPRRGRVDRDGPDLSAYEPRCHTYIAVPFTAPRRSDAVALPPPVPHTAPVPSGRCGAAVGSAVTPPAPDRASGSVAVASGAGAVLVDCGVTGARPALGVLALYDRHGSDEFDDADLVTLRTFARHAAVAVDNVRVHEEAQRLSLTDPLTGLWNYRYLTESIRREVERASRFGRMISVLALDLDRFKEVNDTYGHAAGDVVLVEFARRIRNLVREVDLAFRRGGEEFVVLLPETDARGAATVAERLGAAVRDTPISIDLRGGPAVVADAPPLTVTVSIGIAVYPDHAFAGPQVLDAADEALYAAKAAGRDTYRMAARQPRPAVGEPAPQEPPVVEELVVLAGAAPPDDGLPRAGARPGGASSGPHPPRQSRGR